MKQNSGLLDSLPGYAMRICFCQPYDGAGKSTKAIAIGPCCPCFQIASLSTNRENKLFCDRGASEVEPVDLLVTRMVNHVSKEKVVACKPRLSEAL